MQIIHIESLVDLANGEDASSRQQALSDDFGLVAHPLFDFPSCPYFLSHATSTAKLVEQLSHSDTLLPD